MKESMDARRDFKYDGRKLKMNGSMNYTLEDSYYCNKNIEHYYGKSTD